MEDIIVKNSHAGRHNVKISGVEYIANAHGSWQNIIAQYISEKDCLEASRLSYTRALTQFFRWMEKTGRHIATVSRTDVVDWKNYLYESGHSVQTVDLYIVALHGLFKWTESCGVYPDVARDVKPSRKSQRSGRFIKQHLTDEQGSDLLEHFRDINLRDFALINLMIRTGLRSVEVHRADFGDISDAGNGKHILHVQGKGKLDKSDFVVLTDAAWGPLEDYLQSRGTVLPDAPLFTCEGRNCRGRRISTRTIQFIAKEGMRFIGLDSHAYSAHSLRHTAGVQILLNGGTQFDVQDVLRHSSPVTSQIYLESIKEERRIRESSESLLDASFRTPKSKNPEEQ